MNQIALLIDPIKFPENLFHKALTWAQLHDASFRVIFIAEEKFRMETVDTQQQTSSPDALEPVHVEGHRINVIMKQVKYMRKAVTAAGLQFTSTILVQPRIKDVIDETKHASMIFHELREKLHTSAFDWDELFQQVPMNKQIVSNKAHG